MDNDIMKCMQSMCPVKDACRRYTIKPGLGDTYTIPEDYTEEGCDYFIKKL
ncbi:MAG: hypothetical protein KAH32_07155 [Chlamydiia bacterium]|nr:hypothetical protein [Chlamydiia bacterium]